MPVFLSQTISSAGPPVCEDDDTGKAGHWIRGIGIVSDPGFPEFEISVLTVENTVIPVLPES